MRNPGVETEDSDAEITLVCPRSRLDLLNLVTGQRIALRCRSNRCFCCGPVNARLIARAQGRSGPERSIRFSLVPTEWKAARLCIKRVRERLTDLGYVGNEWAFSLEPNPSGEDWAHAHLVQHGPYIGQETLQEVCQANGLGIPYINRIRGSEGAVGAYGVKAAAAAFYGVKSTRDAEAHQADYKRFVDLNGDRISHHTRGFYRLADGSPTTQGGAIRAMIDEDRALRGSGEDEGSWHVVTKGLSLESARVRRLHALGTRTAGAPL